MPDLTPAQRDALDAGRRLAPPAPPGNSRSLSHGTNSEHKLGPIRDQHMDALRVDYPAADNRRLWLVADCLARAQVAADWLDGKGSVVRTKSGLVFDVADRTDKWVSRAWRMLTDLEAEKALMESEKQADLAKAFAALDGEAEEAVGA